MNHTKLGLVLCVLTCALLACDRGPVEPFQNERFCRGQRAHTRSGIVSKDTWTAAAGPYVLTNDIRVTDSLRIEAGAIICADSGVTINVDGVLLAMGTASEPIIFTATAQPAPWGGIIADDVQPSVHMSRVSNVRIEHAVTGIAFNSPVVIEQARFRQIKRAAISLPIYAQGSRVSGSIIDTAAVEGGAAVFLEGGVFEDNVVRGSGGVGIEIGRRSNAQLLGGRVEGSSGVGIRSDYPTAILTGGAPVRVIGGAGYPVYLPVSILQMVWPDTHIDSLRGNARDTVVFTSGTTNELRIRPGLPWKSEPAEFSSVIGPGGQITLEPGASLSGTVSLAGGRMVAVGTAAQKISLNGRFMFNGGTLPSMMSHINATGQLLANNHRVDVNNAAFAAGSTVYLGGAGSTLNLVTVTGGVPFPAGIFTPAAPAGLSLAGSDIIAIDVVVQSSTTTGVWISGSGTRLTRCDVTSNGEGIRVRQATAVVIRDCNIHSNAGAGVVNESPEVVDAQFNWWGDPAGPAGPAGDGVTGNVDFRNWLLTRRP